MNKKNEFIPRKFKNIETGETVDFETVVNISNISVILGEPASGKTYQLKEYAKNKNSELFLLKMLSEYEKKDIKKYDILLLDSIDEALLKNKDDDILIYRLVKFVERYKKKKIIITCRYLEWKENFEEKLKEVDKGLKIYDIQELSRDDINLLLKHNDINDFWDFIKKNHLKLLLKNIMIVKHLTNNFNRKYQQKNISYIDIYQKIVEQSIKSKGTKREHKQDRRKVKELLPIGASLATYMMLNRKDTVLNENINDIENFVDELYKVENKYIKDNNFKKILDTPLFEKKGDEFSFFHKSIQEYLTAYFINYKKLDSKIIKKIFSHDLKFYEEFEEVIIYLTNIQPHLFNDFVEFDPFIFRRHPSLSKEQQEKLLLSIIDKIQNNEAFTWDKKAFFYNTSLVKFNNIDVYSIIKDKNIENSQSDILLHYIMRLFVENYSQEFEDYIFEIFSQNLNDKIKCSKLIHYSYNAEYQYNVTLFNFMKEHQLFYIDKASNSNSIGDDRNFNRDIVKQLFFVFYGYNYNSPTKRELKNYDIEKIIDLIPFIKYESFVEITSSFIVPDDMGVWLKHILKTYKYGYLPNSDYRDNIGWILYKYLNYFLLSKETLIEIIFFVLKHHISIQPPNFQKYTLLPTSLLFYPIQNDFWELYFSDKIQSFGEIQSFLSFYHIQKNNIEPIVKKYPIEENFMKIFELIEWLERQEISVKSLFFPLTTIQREKLLEYFKSIENIHTNEVLIKNILNLLTYDYSKNLEDFIFELFELFLDNKIKSREYIIASYIKKYKYNIRLFNFMKSNNLLMNPNKYKNEYEKVNNQKVMQGMAYIEITKDDLEEKIFISLYGIELRKNNINIGFKHSKELLCLLEYMPFSTTTNRYSRSSFSNILKHIEVDNDFKQWVDYIVDNYNKNLIYNNFDYKYSIGEIVYKLLINNNFQSIFLEKIIIFFKDTKLSIFSSYQTMIGTSPKALFCIIKYEFWSIYFSDKIKSFEEIKNFISLYKINEKDLNEAIEKYPIEENIEKYYGLGVQYSFINILMENEKYKEYINDKQEVKKTLEKNEQDYLDKIENLEKEKQYYIDIQNVNESNFYYIFEYALEKIGWCKGRCFKELDKKLKDYLKDEYNVFINKVIESFSILKKEYIDNCDFCDKIDNRYNYLFNIISTKEEIDNILISDKNYEKLFWYIILGYISTENKLLFKVIEDKFDLFLNTVIELNDFNENNRNYCYLSWEFNTSISPCRRIIDILKEINFDKKSPTWLDFVKHFESLSKENSQYNDFYKKINPKPPTIEDSFADLTFIHRTDVNSVLNFLYKDIYVPVPEKRESECKLDTLSNLHISHLNKKIFNNNDTFVNTTTFTEEEKKIKDEELLNQTLNNFLKDKNDSYNVEKIILFDILVNFIEFRKYYKNLDDIYIKKVIIDYYKFFKEEKIPLAKDYKDYSGHYFSAEQSKQSPSTRLILNLWGVLQNDKKYIPLLEELKKSKNKNISDSAEYCLLKLYEKQGEERDFINDYYKDILDKGLLPITSSLDLFNVVKEIWDKDIRNWVEAEGAYKFINELAKKERNTNAEDFIQKTIISQMKLGFSEREYKKENYFIKREEQLLDDKRLDFTISYSPFGSIVIELKLAHNAEVQFKQNNEATKKAEEYISKLKQYIKGSNSDFALFVIFNVKEDRNQKSFNEQIDKLKELYKGHNDIDVIGINCVK